MDFLEIVCGEEWKKDRENLASPPKIKDFQRGDMEKILKLAKKQVNSYKPPKQVLESSRKFRRVIKEFLPPSDLGKLSNEIGPALIRYKPEGYDNSLMREAFPVWYYYITKVKKMEETFRQRNYRDFLQATQEFVDSIYLK